MTKIKTIIILLLLTPFMSFSQTESTLKPSKKERRKNQPKFIGITAGISQSILRDFATSPLFYKGRTMYFSITRNKINDWREVDYGLIYYTGNYNAIFNKQTASSKISSASIYYSRLYRLNKLSSEAWNFKVGGEILATGNLRGNHSLQNNGRGIESFHSLLGSVKITRDLSRKETKDRKFLFFKYTLNPVKMNLAFRFNVGLVNSYYRNGFIYANQTDIKNGDKLLEGYKFHFFSGQILSSALDYTYYLKNKNALQISYIWRAYTTNENVNNFEMANHTLKFTLLFNTNNK